MTSSSEEEFAEGTAAAMRLKIAVRAALAASPIKHEELAPLRKAFGEIWKAELTKLAQKYPRGAASFAGDTEEQKEVRAIMRLVAEVIGPEGMHEGGAIWRTCIQGSKEHPPRPAEVLRAFYLVREDLKRGVQIRSTISAYAWSVYQRLVKNGK